VNQDPLLTPLRPIADPGPRAAHPQSCAPEHLTLAPAQLADAPVVLALQHLAYQSEAALNDDYTIPPLTQTLSELEADFQRQFYLKALSAGTIVGAVRGYAQNGTCYIGRLMVLPACQNRGLGTQLLRAIEAHFNVVRRYELFTSERSTCNLYLYQKLGYHIYRTEQLTAKVTIVYLEKLNSPTSAA
jgi:ribosomal protein S18 acetylase RimI-like enzyme